MATRTNVMIDEKLRREVDKYMKTKKITSFSEMIDTALKVIIFEQEKIEQSLRIKELEKKLEKINTIGTKITEITRK